MSRWICMAMCLVLVFCSLPAWAEVDTAVAIEIPRGNLEDVDYSYIMHEDGSAEIVGYSGESSELRIPGTVGGCAVTSIGEGAFAGNVKLQTVIFPEGLIRIDARAFFGCAHLYALQLPDSLECIGDYAFYSCSALQEAVLPDGLVSIGRCAFSSCTNLRYIALPDSLTSIGDFAFELCNELPTVWLPDSVMEVGINPFKDCMKLADIYVTPDHPLLAQIDGVLFNKVTKQVICYPCGLSGSRYVIPEGIRSIGPCAFHACDKLKEVALPDSVTSIDENSFGECTELTTVYPSENLLYIKDAAFYKCKSLMAVPLPGSLESIGDMAFCGCESLKIVTLPNSLRRMGTNPYAECENLLDIYVPEGNELFTISEGALISRQDDRLVCYPHARPLVHYDIPEGIRIIDAQAFYNCEDLSDVQFSDGLVRIGDYAFADCTYLKHPVLPEAVEVIGMGAFRNCSFLRKIFLPGSLTSMGLDVFEGCPDIEFVVLPDSYAMDYCDDSGLKYTVMDWETGVTYALDDERIHFPIKLSTGGSWYESVIISSDWSFVGKCYDGGEDGTYGEYIGTFANPEMVSDNAVKLDVAGIDREDLCLKEGDTCILYLPGTPKEQMPEQTGLDPYDDLYDDMGDVSDFYALEDLTGHYVFAGYVDD